MTIDTQDNFAMFEAPLVRAALHCFRRMPHRANLLENKVLFPQRRDGALLIEEFIDRGHLISGSAGDSLSPSGMAVSERPIRPDTSRQRADRDLGHLLEAVQQSNDGPYAIDDIEEVWISGDYLKAGAAVRQLDVHIKLRRRDGYGDTDQTSDYARQTCRRLHARIPRAMPDASLPGWLSEMLIFGERRSVLFRDAQLDLQSLKLSGVPCRRLFERHLGLVRDPVLPCHPDSHAAAASASPPSLPLEGIRPMDGTWTSAYRSWGRVSPYALFRGFSPEALALFSEIPEGLRVVGAEPAIARLDWLPPSLLDGNLDGRERLGLFAHGLQAGFGCVLTRQIEMADRETVLHCGISGIFGKDAPATIGRHATSVAAVVALIAAADADRLVRRGMEAGSDQVRIVLAAADSGEDVANYVAGLAARHLRERQVRVEPVGWSGKPVEVDGPQFAEPERPLRALVAREQTEWLNERIDLEF